MRTDRFPLLIAILLGIMQGRCSKAGGKSDLSELTYELARTSTNTTTNSLLLEFSKSDGYSFLVDGDGFDADVLLGKSLDVVDKVNFDYPSEGIYTVSFQVFYDDGSIMLEDQLSWEYSSEKPEEPHISFSEDATNDRDVVMVAPVTLDADTNELWVEGDVIAADEGWHAITNLKVPVHTTKDDGMKYFTVKYRNRFGTESGTQDLQILKKSVEPTDCVTTVNTRVTGNGKVIVHFAATNDGPLYYQLSGDIAGVTGDWEEFEESISVSATIIDNDSVNYVNAKLRDIAGNFCPTKIFEITYDENHEPFFIGVEGDLLTTDDEDITVLPQLDYNPSDEVEMYIHGDIDVTSDTFTWIAYRASVDVSLSPVDGNRFVRVKYKINGEETSVNSRAIYLKPFIHIAGVAAPYTISLSEIVDLDTLTVSGCVENYTNIAPTTSVSCNPTGANVSVTYNLTDGTTVNKSVAVPP